MKTLVLGASTNEERYANKAVKSLKKHGHEVIAVGIRKGSIDGVPIIEKPDSDTSVHTVSVYLNPEKQKSWYDSILKLKPERVIFNPGAENSEFEKILKGEGIEVTKACTLVLLSTDSFE